MYITTATRFGIFYKPSSGNTLQKSEAFIPRNTIFELANLHKTIFPSLDVLAIEDNGKKLKKYKK